MSLILIVLNVYEDVYLTLPKENSSFFSVTRIIIS